MTEIFQIVAHTVSYRYGEVFTAFVFYRAHDFHTKMQPVFDCAAVIVLV